MSAEDSNGGYNLDISSIVEQLGNHPVAIGEHSDVWVGDMKTTSKSTLKVAIKVLRGGSTSNQDFIRRLRTNINSRTGDWIQFEHPNVARFHGIATNLGNMPALVLTYYPNGNIVNYIKDTKPDNEAKLLLVQEIAQGMEYLHNFQNPIVHGDIRGANVLIDEQGHALLADYGLVFIIDSSDFTSIKTAGTCRWTAPEIMNPPEELLDVDEPVAIFTKPSDIYAFSMTVIEIYTEDIPFKNKKHDSSVIFFVLAGNRPELPDHLITGNQVLGDLIKSCWDVDPSNRPTAKAILEKLKLGEAETLTWPDKIWRCISYYLRPFGSIY